MAVKTPVTDNTVAGYVVPGKGMYGGVGTTTNNLLTDVDQHLADRQGLKEDIFYFGPSNSAKDIDNGDVWTSNIPGIVRVFWSAADATDDLVNPVLTAAANGEITFISTNSNNEGWLLVKHGG